MRGVDVQTARVNYGFDAQLVAYGGWYVHNNNQLSLSVCILHAHHGHCVVVVVVARRPNVATGKISLPDRAVLFPSKRGMEQGEAEVLEAAAAAQCVAALRHRRPRTHQSIMHACIGGS